MNEPATPVTIDDLIARRNELEQTPQGPYHHVLHKQLVEIAADLVLQEGKPGLDSMRDLFAHDVMEKLATPLTMSSIIEPWPGFRADIAEREHEQAMATIRADALYGAPIALDEAACLRLSIADSYEPPSPVWCPCAFSTTAPGRLGHIGYLVRAVTLTILRDIGSQVGDLSEYRRQYFTGKLKRRPRKGLERKARFMEPLSGPARDAASTTAHTGPGTQEGMTDKQ